MKIKHALDMKIHNHLMAKSNDQSINGRTAVPLIKTEQESNATDTREPLSTTIIDDDSKENESSVEDTAINRIEDAENRPKKRIRVLPLPLCSKTRDTKRDQLV